MPVLSASSALRDGARTQAPREWRGRRAAREPAEEKRQAQLLFRSHYGSSVSEFTKSQPKTKKTLKNLQKHPN